MWEPKEYYRTVGPSTEKDAEEEALDEQGS
jgi:hypothetical protein